MKFATDDVTSGCQIKCVKSHGHVINSGTILPRNNFNFMLFLTLKEFWRSVKFWLSYSKLNLARFWDTVYYHNMKNRSFKNTSALS